jgi:catechol 2,3-dioxygenase-like lactoylglutathione lyase family enzyme
VSDVDRAKQFYEEQMGFSVLVDHQPNESFRVVQLDPPGSSCAIAIGKGVNNEMQPGSVKGLHLMVTDIVAARDELVGRGAEVEEIWSMGRDGARTEGPHPGREDYSSFASLTDPDGNLWLIQERGFSG